MSTNQNDVESTPEQSATESSEPIAIVGIGASAGGLEALEQFFDSIAPTTGMGFVVIQHLSPSHKSLMAELLSEHTAMNVKKAADYDRVEANSVYLIPSEKNLRIEDGELRLVEREGLHEINLPIDLFLTSLAIDQEEKAIGVILSGTGSDGRRGIESVKENDGYVFVQEESSAKFDGMPRAAISTGMADYIQTPSEIASTLNVLADTPRPSWKSVPNTVLHADESGLDRVMAILRDRTNVDFAFYKLNTVTRRVERRMHVNHMDSLADYVRFIENSESETTSLYQELMIGVTGFFRDPDVFAKLAATWFPTLFKQQKKQEYRFWIAGCSTGQEAYSLSILAHECTQKLGISPKIKIFATDLDRDAVANASTGEFPLSAISEIPGPLIEKYFTVDEQAIRISRRIRESIVFAHHNLIRDPPFTNIDLVSCRNLLIYLQPILQLKTLEMLNFSLNRGGFLILGTSETTGEMSDYFDNVDSKAKIFRCKGRHRIATPFSMSQSSKMQATESAPVPYYRSNIVKQRIYEDRVLERVTAALAEKYFLCALVVRESLDVIHVFGNAEGLLSIPVGKLQTNLESLIRKELRIPVTSGIQKIVRGENSCRYERIPLHKSDALQLVDVDIVHMDERSNDETLLLVLISKTRSDDSNLELPGNLTFDVSRETENHVKNLESELEFTRENLQATIEELETSNEELQATNEELLASNEELQSTNEELQSVNEELYTVNAEYQSKINELTETNNDLDNLLSNTQVATIFLDENLEIRRYTQDATQIFDIFVSDVGRPISHLRHHIDRVDLLSLLNEVQTSHCCHEQEVQVGPSIWYLMRIIPYSISPRIYSGIVLTFVDITHIKCLERDLAEAGATLNLISEVTDAGIVTIDEYGIIDSVNQAVESILGYSSDELVGKNVSELMPQPERSNHNRYIQNYINSGEAKIIGKSRAVNAQHKNGSVVPVRLMVDFMNISGSRRFVGFMQPLKAENENENPS